MRRIIWSASAILTLLPITAWSQPVSTQDESCESSSHLDIADLEADFDSATNTITAVLHTCGPVNPNSKGTRYFLYADYLAPTILDADRDGDSVIEGDEADDACAETADATYWWGGSEPSLEAYLDPTDPTATTIKFDIDASMLPPETSEIYLWAAAGNFQGGRGVVDRAPNTNRKDKCDKPQNEQEALKLPLGSAPAPDPEPGPSEQLSCLCWSSYDLASLEAALGPSVSCMGGASWTEAIAAGKALYADVSGGSGFCQIALPGLNLSRSGLSLDAGEVCRAEILKVCNN